ncbi:sensor histidine kinase [Parabacteroides sp. OttesenSCG-928-G07]|nr:sensor histidine kinase [Parabacteroides sp. OttesenSCG-928-G07]
MRKKTITTVILHISIWLLIFAMPFITIVLNNDPIADAVAIFDFMWIVVVCQAVIYYVNDFLFVDKLLTKKYFILFIIANALLLIGIRHGVIYYYQENGLSMDSLPLGTRLAATIGFFIMGVVIICISVAFKMTRGWYKAESERKELQQQTTESELKWLKSQLNPHFIFNTLNNIYSQISTQPENAKESVQQLSEMLRYVLYESSEKYVPLEDELGFVKNYIELMRIRQSSRVKLDVEIEEPEPGSRIVPLLFISLIENAFKHGVSASKPSFVSIRFEQTQKEIRFLTVNSYFPKTEKDKGGSGIGLVNIQKRLELAYPNQYSFKCGQIGEEYRSELIIKTPKSKKS